MSKPLLLAIASCVLALGCGAAMPVYPPRPSDSAAKPVADPTPSRVVLHATITGSALRESLEQAIPGTEVDLLLLRDGTFRRVTVRLGAQPRVPKPWQINPPLIQPPSPWLGF
jgi:hypothetical protein